MKLDEVQDLKKLTPAMQQYANLKKRNKEALLFFRMGDFYELFFDDAVITAKELNITLTRRGKISNDNIPMCGIPFHAINNYVPKLVKKGYEIAICEQTISPKEMASKGMKGPLTREITRIITPGTLIDEFHVESNQNNFLGCLTVDKTEFSLSWLDVSTGSFLTNVFKYKTIEEFKYKIENIFNKISVSELLVSDLENKLTSHLNLKIKVKKINNIFFSYKENYQRLKNYYNLEISKWTLNELQVISCGVIIYYLEHAFKKNLPQLRYIEKKEDTLFLEIDKTTISSLEIINTISGEKDFSLLSIIDKTLTASGSRLIKERLLAPSFVKNEIKKRQKIAIYLVKNNNFKEKLKDSLKKITDFERSLLRVSLNALNPKELLILAENLKIILEIKSYIKDIKNEDKNFNIFYNKINLNEKYICEIIKAINNSVIDGNNKNDFINKGYNNELDTIRELQESSGGQVIDLQLEYSNITNINSLKIKYNKVLGYHIEIRSNHFDKMKSYDQFIHRQTTAQTIRYTTKELLDLETKINQANQRMNQLENEIYSSLKNQILTEKNNIFEVSDVIAQLDIANMTANQKLLKNYEIPEIVENKSLYIKNGRHPVIEETLPLKSDYSSNSCELKDGHIWLITGPNMAGKSTFLRQNAIIIILAQAGFFIPAEKGTVGLVDKIFSRVGASDNLSKGQSTFMVEMTETAAILTKATDKSFIIFDEVGRGTSTYDGLAIAWAILEYLIGKLKAKVLFATHYHELTKLKNKSKQVKNYKMEIKEWDSKIVFLYKIIEGDANKSYGIEVAKLAGLPKDLIINAKQILLNLEGKSSLSNIETLTDKNVERNFLKNHLENYLDKIDPNNMTPLDALNTLFKIKELLKIKNKKEC